MFCKNKGVNSERKTMNNQGIVYPTQRKYRENSQDDRCMAGKRNSLD